MGPTSQIKLAGKVADCARYLLQCRPLVDRLDTGFGLGGIALFFLYKYRWQKQHSDLIHAQETLHLMLKGVDELGKKGGFLIEMTELAFFLRYYAAELQLEDEAASVLPILEVLMAMHTETLLSKGDLDPYTGAFLPAYYFLHFPEGNEAVVKRALRSIPSTKGSQGNAEDTAMSSGISHGLAFYLLYACQAVEQGIDAPYAQSLVVELQAKLAQRKNDFTQAGCYFFDGGDGKSASRVCLAYGDLGILYAQLRAAKCLGDKSAHQQLLNELQQTSLRRSKKETGIRNDSLLYGRAGAYLFYDLLHKIAPQQGFDETSIFWRKALGESLAQAAIPTSPGFTQYTYQAMQQVSFYEGIAGSLMAQMAVDTQSQDFRHLFYLT